MENRHLRPPCSELYKGSTALSLYQAATDGAARKTLAYRRCCLEPDRSIKVVMGRHLAEGPETKADDRDAESIRGECGPMHIMQSLLRRMFGQPRGLPNVWDQPISDLIRIFDITG